MKKLIFSLLFLSNLIAQADNQRINLSSDVNGVKVFLSGAQVIRTAKGTC
jgi:hypothetical protein